MSKQKSIPARYAGTCAKTGVRYGVGTQIIQNTAKKWEIAPGCAPIEHIRIQFPNAVRVLEWDGTHLSLGSRPCICGQCALPEIEAGTYVEAKGRDRAYRPDVQLVREGDLVTCPTCKREMPVLAPEAVKAHIRATEERKTCWECGRDFTYRECKAHDGEWSDDYCGC